MILKLSIKNEIDSAIPDYHLGSERLRFNPLFSYRLSINGAELSDFISFCDFQNLSSGIDFCLASERRKVDFWVDGFLHGGTSACSVRQYFSRPTRASFGCLTSGDISFVWSLLFPTISVFSVCVWDTSLG